MNSTASRGFPTSIGRLVISAKVNVVNIGGD